MFELNICSLGNGGRVGLTTAPHEFAAHGEQLTRTKDIALVILSLDMNSMSDYETSYQLMKEDSPYLAAIGEMVVAWSFFEHRLDVTIFNLAGPRECECRIPSQLAGPASKFQAIIDLCHLRQVPEYLIEELNKISQDGAALSLRRNRFIHDPWFDGGVQLYKEYLQNKLRHYKRREARLDNIKDFIANMDYIDYRMAEIRTKILHDLIWRKCEVFGLR
jgi:hypothetical protein